jgi:predicted RNA-binding protein with PIN domain
MYLIDGNNVMGQRVGWHRDKPAARRHLLEELARLARARKTRLAVVFDGRPDDQFPDGTSYRSVRIHYAGPGSDADTRIVEMVEATTNKRNLTVVTSDRGLTARVRVCGVRVVKSGVFRQFMEEAQASGELTTPPTLADHELENWLRYFGVPPEEDGEDPDEEEDSSF